MSNKLNDSTYEQFKHFLLTSMPRGKMTLSGKEFTCACPFCGDSKSDPYATSFYINMDPESERFLNYHCFRANCNTNGVVNDDFFSMIGFTKNDCIKDIMKYFQSKSINVGGKYRSRNSKSLINAVCSMNAVSDKKLSYINKRIGTSLSYQDIYNLKINLNLKELLQINQIDIQENKIDYYSRLSDYGIAFISAYNDYVIILDVSKSGKLKKRYTNVNIFDNYDNVTKTYCIPTNVDLLEPSACVINIAEGVFDILSVYFNLKINRRHKNQIFLAACGSGIVSTIMSYIQQYGFINCKINIFSDTDVKLDKYTKLNLLKPYLKSFDVDVYYNDMPGEKDFGVTKDKIRIIKTKL